MEKNNHKDRSKNMAVLTSVVVAIILWFVVALTGAATSSITRKDIPLNITVQEEVLKELGLSVIEIEQRRISAEITGERVAIGKITAEELTATIQLANLNFAEAGTIEASLIPVNSSIGQSRDFKVVYNPGTITLKLDNIESRSFPVELNITNDITVTDGFIQGKAVMLTPKDVIITGPKVELDKIHKVLVELELENSLEKNYAGEHTARITDAQGSDIDLVSHHLTIDNPKVQVVIPILAEAELPMRVEFLNIPRGFPIEQLSKKISNKTIRVAGPVDVMDNYNELLLGFIDVSQISRDNNTFSFDVELPENFVNMDNVLTVNVELDSSGWTETTFTLADNINILNVPEGYKVELITGQIPNVKVVGEESIIESLLEDDFVAEVDLAERNDLIIGQYQYPVKISLPTKGVAWIYGEYSVVVKVSEKLEDEPDS